MTTRGPSRWNARYEAGHDLWRHGPHPAVIAVVPCLSRGVQGRPRAVDLGAGDGRHAVWLAREGWQVQAVDYAEAGVLRGQEHAAAAGVEVSWSITDVADWEPSGPVDLVLMSYFTLDQQAFDRVVGWVRPGGHLLVIAHSETGSRTRGPRGSQFRQSTQTLRDRASGLDILLCETWRPTGSADDDAPSDLDVVLLARVRSAADGPAPPP